MLLGFFAFFALTSPVLASIVNSVNAPAPTQENLWAPVEIAKPEAVPIDVNAFASSRLPIHPRCVPHDEFRRREVPTVVPTDAPTESADRSRLPRPKRPAPW